MTTTSTNARRDSRLVAFVYVLLREHLTFGSLEEVLRNHLSGAEDYVLSEAHIAEYSRNVVRRLMLGEPCDAVKS